MLVPHRDFAGTVFSSILPYQAAARRVVVMAGAPIETLDMPLDRLAHAASAPMDLRLWVEPGDATLGWLRMGQGLPARESADLCFDPGNTGPELRPVGMLNRLRRPTYAASQEGRGARSSRPVP